MNCASCGIKACKNNEENLANSCPNNKKEEINELKEFYQTEENFKIAKVAAELSLPQGLTRIEETMEFARRLKYKKIGLAFCSALANEAKIIDSIKINHSKYSFTIKEIESSLINV